MQFGYLALLLVAVPLQQSTVEDRSHIEIINTGKYIPVGQFTNIDAGPNLGNILNAHYFPGINLYNGGRYKEALTEFNYFTLRPDYLDGNPRKAEFQSTAFYLRGMIYLHHAKGVGRQTAAREDFEAALEWNPQNYVVLIELSRLYKGLGFPDQAASVLRHLLTLNPEEEIARQAQADLGAINQK
jgi:tetratricopeptide (TPR) repeat protein